MVRFPRDCRCPGAWHVRKMGSDTINGCSGPVATVIQDVLTLLTYFAFVSVLY